jgi:hypothetical protein
MFQSATAVKTYYYKDGKQEKVIGNEEVYQRVAERFSSKKVFTKMTKAKRKIMNTKTFIINSMNKKVIKQHVTDILSKLKSKGYKYSWPRPDKGGAIVDHWYTSNCYKCN